MSYDRIKAVEERQRQEFTELLAEVEATDDAKDARHGPGRRGDELRDELARRQGHVMSIQRAKTLLRERARAEAATHRQAEVKCRSEGLRPAFQRWRLIN